jgi:hypothetical protein
MTHTLFSPNAAIRVTADHIAAGVPGDAHACPIALAIKDQWEGPRAIIEVDAPTACVYLSPVRWVTAQLPTEGIRFIHNFDNKLPVTPVELAVEWIDQDGVGWPTHEERT